MSESTNFIRQKIDADIEAGRTDTVVTRFPPEPNGYLHIGHAKSICLNFGIARDYNGRCNLRFDDTNPEKENDEYVQSIRDDVAWLGFAPDGECFASDYFEQLYQWACQLIQQGKAYVDEQTPEQIRVSRGTLTTPGTPSPFRDRPSEESLELFAQMKEGKHPEGSMVLRAKIDMAHPNMTMRDPAMYRIRNVSHHRTGDAWNIYPMYDFAHGQSDAIEGVTHSLCTLEFEDHRPLYDWFVDALELPEPRPHQTEFARLNLSYTVLSKRKLIELVEQGHVNGWDDPRMPTISGMRRRGFPPEAIVDFCERIGVARANSLVDTASLHYSVRTQLNEIAQRRMVVFDPVRVTITNYQDCAHNLQATNNPERESDGTRPIRFGPNLLVERADFRKDANRKWYRLTEGREVRFLHGYYVTCNEAIYDGDQLVELRCTMDPETPGGWSEDGRKVKGTIHWLNADDAVEITVRKYQHLFTQEDLGTLGKDESYLNYLNPQSCQTVTALAEPSLAGISPGTHLQFVRDGYYFSDPVDTDDNGIAVINQTVGLRDSFGA